MSFFLIISIIFSYETFSNIEDDFNKIKKELSENYLSYLNKEIEEKKNYLETININDDTYNITLHEYYHFLGANKEFNIIIELAQNEFDYFLDKVKNYNCRVFNRSLTKKIKKINNISNKIDYNKLIDSKIINRNIINFFEYTYLFFIYLKEQTNFYSLDYNICDELNTYTEEFIKLEIEKKILETSAIISRISASHNTIITWYSVIEINNFIDNRGIDYNLTSFLYNNKNIFSTYLKIHNLLKIIEINLFSYISKETFIKFKIYKINILSKIFFIKEHSYFRSKNTYVLIDNNTLYFTYKYNMYYSLFSDLVAELVYNFSDINTNLKWNNLNIKYQNIDNTFILNNFSIEEQKAYIIKSFFNNPKAINEKFHEYIKFLFSAEYLAEEKIFKSVNNFENIKNLKTLLGTDSTDWVTRLNQFLSINFIIE